MGANRFDSLARSLADPASRRGVLRGAFGAMVGAVSALRSRPAAAITCAATEHKCGSGSNEYCCPFLTTCCGDSGQCCTGAQFCQRSPSGSSCRETCPIGEHPCGGDGACCPFFDGACCGDGNRTCCREPNICDSNTGGLSACATPCDIYSRRCGTSGVCCPYGQQCCGASCCYRGTVCKEGTRCVKSKKRGKRRRRHHH